MPKNKPHKGLLKRIRITKSGRVKMHRAFGQHLRSHKSGSTIRKYRLPAYVCSADMKRIKGLLGLKARKRAPIAAAETPVEAKA